MNIAIIGATGNGGSRLLDEALRRGHHVIAIARDASRVKPHDNVTARSADVAISSGRFVNFKASDLLPALKQAGVKRLAVVGAPAAWRAHRARP